MSVHHSIYSVHDSAAHNICNFVKTKSNSTWLHYVIHGKLGCSAFETYIQLFDDS